VRVEKFDAVSEVEAFTSESGFYLYIICSSKVLTADGEFEITPWYPKVDQRDLVP
jgi:hypothetical protein